MFSKISQKNKGILCIIASAFSFAFMNIFVRMAGDLPAVQKSFFRNFVAMFFALAMLWKLKIPMKTDKGSWKYLLVRAGFGTLGILGNFYAIDHMKVADASMLNKLSPFFAILFSFLFLKEKLKVLQGLCVFTAFVGTMFIVKPGFQEVSLIPAMAGVFGGMTAGLAYTMVRVLSKRGVKGPFIVFFFSAFSCAFTLPLMLLDFQPMTLYQVLILLGAGLAATGGQFGITMAYSFAPAREVSIYDYSQIIFATFFSFILLGEVPDHYSFIGYVIILSASLGMFLYNNHQYQKELHGGIHG